MKKRQCLECLGVPTVKACSEERVRGGTCSGSLLKPFRFLGSVFWLVGVETPTRLIVLTISKVRTLLWSQQLVALFGKLQSEFYLVWNF